MPGTGSKPATPLRTPFPRVSDCWVAEPAQAPRLPFSQYSCVFSSLGPKPTSDYFPEVLTMLTCPSVPCLIAFG